MTAHGKRRALGQHFLKDAHACELIARTGVEAAQRDGSRTILEIGPGRGAITDHLIRHLEAGDYDKLILCERHDRLAGDWRIKSALNPKIRVEEADFLSLPEEKWLVPKLTVVSNLPYSVGTAILTRLAKYTGEIGSMTLMFQAEVARRLFADVSTKEWGSLSIWIQNRWDVESLLEVPPESFNPPPDVDSEVVTLTRRATPRIAVAPDAEERWESLLRICFAHRRKMLRSGLPKEGRYRNALELSGVDGTKRAEALSWEEWDRLFNSLP